LKKLIVLLLFTTLAFSQKNIAESIDSVAYYIKLGDLYKSKNNYKLSLENSTYALRFATKKNDGIGKAKALTSIGNIYFDLNKTEEAKATYLKSVSELIKEPLSSDLALNYYKIGLCYMSMEEFELAEIYFNKAEIIYNTLQIDNEDLINLQKGIVYKNKGKTELASNLFYQIISKSDNPEKYNTKAEALYQLGNIELKKARNNLSLNYLSRALTINSYDKNTEQRIRILYLLSVVNDKLLNLKESHYYLKAHVQLKDSLANIEKNRLISSQYNTIKENERIKLFEELSKEKEEQQKTNKFTKMIGILAISLITILSLLSLSLYKNNIIRSKSNKLLKEKNNELEIAKEKAEKASQARADFLSTVSHELRTPLNAINGITHLLLEENPKENQLHYLKSLKFSGNYLLTFINDILEINRIESNNIEVEHIHYNPEELLINIHNSLKQLANNNNNKLLLDFDKNIPKTCLGDPTKMSQIFLNLINNALKFTKNGEVKVIAELFGMKDNIATIHFEVKDTGIGIAEDKLGTIFESFAQGSIEINRKYGGTGLGLAIVKKLVELLGGEIKLESELGKGTSFYFDLDLEVSTISEEIEVESETADRKTENDVILEGKKVLIVEDNKINQMITRKMIEKKGMTADIIDNGEDAIEIIKNKNTYDLILMDVHLPGINGTIATKQIRKFNQTIPVIALTAISLHENRGILLSFGMNDVITKPFDPANFYAVIAKVLSNSKLTA
jgi:signal transduction histidine kinase/CheY-like chemotaxis protein